MKRFICMLIVFSMALPVFADGMLKVMDTSEYKKLIDEKTNIQSDNVVLKTQLERCSKLNTGLLIDNNKLLAENIQKDVDMETGKATSKTAKYILGGLGAWGVYTFYITGGLYPIVTSCLFLYGAMR